MDSNGCLATIRLPIRPPPVAMHTTTPTLTNQDSFTTLVVGETRIAPLGIQASTDPGRLPVATDGAIRSGPHAIRSSRITQRRAMIVRSHVFSEDATCLLSRPMR